MTGKKGMKRLQMQKDELIYLYTSKSLSQIAKEKSVSVTTVWNAFQRHNIKSRTKTEGLKINWKNRTRKPSEQGNWNGGRTYDGKGYVLIYKKGHPRTIKKDYVYEHILNWEKANNKTIPKGSIVHHLNGIRDDNRPENLSVLPNKQAHSTWTITQLLQKRIQELEPNNKENIPKKTESKGITRFYDGEGYVKIHAPLNHPRAYLSSDGIKRYVFEHIINWEKANNKQAPRGSIIHHLNGIRDDNRSENLVLIPSRKEHTTWTIVNLLKERIRKLETAKGGKA